MAKNLIEAGEEFDRFVGSYVREYARLEFILRIAFKRHSGLNDETYDILIGLPRTGEVTSKLKKLFPRLVADASVRLEAERAFNQLDAVTWLRDNLVHYGGQAQGLERVLVRCKPHQTMKQTGFAHSIHDWSEMHGAHSDLTLIADFFHFHLVHQPPTRVVRNLLRKSVQLPDAWRYKSPELLQRQK
ncbi:hypothetical protein N0B44_20680 [Roseibacterium beibuensis]|uniref:hypothetical protein n=1 Tax=[Roseibacterium] beibuensis TaxID=1193142 RepID=UPI00217DEBB6|nr:hypothetical protein [Roseibacterium beibuensis]MCS6625332.1 hypothetical protein [Roseibacterium beibuensis]